MEHKCYQEQYCSCYIQGLEPSEDCRIHGFMSDNKCDECGRFFKLSEDKNKHHELKCEDCGTNKNVYSTICPFANEISNTLVNIIVCEDCYKERVLSV